MNLFGAIFVIMIEYLLQLWKLNFIDLIIIYFDVWMSHAVAYCYAIIFPFGWTSGHVQCLIILNNFHAQVGHRFHVLFCLHRNQNFIL